MVYKKINKKGFTVIEIMISLSVFSLAMMLVMAVVIGMGKQYQKASYTTQLNSASRSISQEIAKDINYGGNVDVGPDGDLGWVCLSDGIVYAWKQSPHKDNMNYGLFKGIKSPSETCTEDIANNIISTGTNILPPNSFVGKLELSDSAGGTKSLITDFRSGTADMFEGSDPAGNCLPTLKGGDFCAIVQYNSVLKQRIRII